MRYGNCVPYKNINQIKILKEAGFDYIETQLSAFHSASGSEIDDFISFLDKTGIKCEAVNVLFPGGTILTGENADFTKVSEYLDEVFEKTKNIGYKVVVFGSGAARKCPDGFDKNAALGQVIGLTRQFLIPAAEKYDFTLAIEELNRGETNIINTIEEAEDIVNRINHPRVKIIADLYHIGLEKGDVTKLAGMGDTIAHCHIANPYNKRAYPHASDSPEAIESYKRFFGSLKSAGYDGRVSIEGGLGGFSFENISISDDDKFRAESMLSLGLMKGLNL